MTFVGLLRHGAAEGGEVYRGRTDDPLSAVGWAQMRSAMADLNQWDLIVSSPLQRCAAFAESFAQRHGIPLTLEEGLAEIDFGDWEGRSAAELIETSATALADFWRDPRNHTPPGGESLVQFQHRVIEVWEEICRDHEGECLLLVTHGGVIRMLLCHLQGWPLERFLQIEVNHASLFGLQLAAGSLKRFLTSRAMLLDYHKTRCFERRINPAGADVQEGGS